MDPSQFSSDSPGTLHFHPAGFWTFHPYSLPPLFRWSDRLVAALSRADRAVARWGALGGRAPDGFGGLAARIEAAASCRLAGLETGLGAIFEFEAAFRPDEPGSPGPVDGSLYAATLESVCKAGPDGGVGLPEIEAIHAGLFPGGLAAGPDAGSFRRGQTWIGTEEEGPAGAVFVPPPPEEMAHELENLEAFIRDDRSLPPLVRLALVHYQFEVIHPFYDANGRVGRLLNTLLLCRWGLLPGPVLALSRYMLDHAAAYDGLISGVCRENRVEDWLAFLLDGLAESVAAAEGLLDDLEAMRAMYADRIAGERTADRLAQVIGLALVRPYLNVGQIDAALDPGNFKSVSRYVDRLVELGILEETTGQKRNRVFAAREWVERLEGML